VAKHLDGVADVARHCADPQQVARAQRTGACQQRAQVVEAVATRADRLVVGHPRLSGGSELEGDAIHSMRRASARGARREIEPVRMADGPSRRVACVFLILS
jgi:hypothetical protein